MRYILPQKEAEQALPLATVEEVLAGAQQTTLLTPYSIDQKTFSIPCTLSNSSIPGVFAVDGVNQAACSITQADPRFLEIKTQDSVYLQLTEDIPNDLTVAAQVRVISQGSLQVDIVNLQPNSITIPATAGNLIISKKNA